MATAKQTQTIVNAYKRIKVEYEWRSFLGIFGSWREKKATQIDDDLHIDIHKPEQYKNIYVNGIKLNQEE